MTPKPKGGLQVRLPFTTPSKSRQKEAGDKRRRENMREKNSDISELHNKVRIFEVTTDKLEEENLNLVIENCDLERKVTALEADKSEKFRWMKII